MNDRVKRNRPNFGARDKQSQPNRTFLSMNHFVPNVKRNKDLYSFIAMMDCTIKKLSIFVSTMKEIKSFDLNIIFHHGSDLIQKTYEIKPGHNEFVDDTTKIDSGEVVRFDISRIDSVYNNVSGVTIGILLTNEVGK